MSEEWWWRLLEKLLAGLGVVATAVMGLLYRRYSTDRAMLLRHHELLGQNDAVLGLLETQRIETSRGPIGTELEGDLRSINEQLEDLRAEDVELQRLIREEEKDRLVGEAKVEGKLLALEAKLDSHFGYIKESLVRIEKK